MITLKVTKLSQNSLHSDYLDLLDSYGLKPKRSDSTVCQKLDMLQKMSKNTQDASNHTYVKERLKAIDAINEATGGVVKERLKKIGIEDGTGELTEPAGIVSEMMEKEKITLPTELYFNVFPTGAFNACAQRTDNGMLILLNSGLLKLIYNISCACCFPVHSEDGHISLIENENNDRDIPIEIVSLSATIRVILKYINETTHDYQMPANEELKPWGVLIATILSRSMKSFVVAHEISHIVLGHMNNAEKVTIMTPYGPITSLLRSHQKEFEADRWAQRILILNDKVNSSSFPYSIGGICFLSVHIMILKVLSKLRPKDVNECTESHPSSNDRLLALQKDLYEQVDEDYHRSVLGLCALLWRILGLVINTNIVFNNNHIVLEINSRRYIVKDVGNSLT